MERYVRRLCRFIMMKGPRQKRRATDSLVPSASSRNPRRPPEPAKVLADAHYLFYFIGGSGSKSFVLKEVGQGQRKKEEGKDEGRHMLICDFVPIQTNDEL